VIDVQRIGNRVEAVLADLQVQLTAAQARMVLRGAQHCSGQIRKAIYARGSGRTGQLARSFAETFLGTEAGVVSAMSASDLIYARIQDEGSGYLPGGVIRPRNMKALAVPIGPLRSVGEWPRAWPRDALTFVPRGNKPPLLVEIKKKMTGRKGKKVEVETWIPRYVLLKSVRITGKPYMEPAADASLPGLERIGVAELAAGAKAAVPGKGEP